MHLCDEKLYLRRYVDDQLIRLLVLWTLRAMEAFHGHEAAGAAGVRDCIGRQLSSARRERNLSRQDLGKMLGVSPEQIEKYETGKESLPAGRLYQLSVLLDLPVTEFFRQSDEEAPL